MNFLVDTHALLQFFAGDERIPAAALDAMTDARASRAVSMASLWEIAIKVGNGKLTISQSLNELIAALEKFAIEILPIGASHVIHVSSLPHHHRDPFDRLIVAQCLIEGMALVSSDAALDAYGIERIWNASSAG